MLHLCKRSIHDQLWLFKKKKMLLILLLYILLFIIINLMLLRIWLWIDTISQAISHYYTVIFKKHKIKKRPIIYIKKHGSDLCPLTALTRWRQRCTWSTSRRWDLCCRCSSVSCMAVRAPHPSEQTSGSASGLMTPQTIRLRRMFIWGWGCTQHWALHKVRNTNCYSKNWMK